ncbi:FusB/FusC family EF-G-binding protein [Oceanobacillus sp. ISL-73]|uniref:FusB/FusC family EF-G-binding protein n=1 Tax=Oceanobacillus sp. ISL-73 TaxID=2819161 RepID=UPI001BEC92C6|nr:FusB/FusC family EF-G-binding protein [Oceanobacillus sp. ISL-73]MBT2652948.1 FusB/FusC family EF-G-binding protein [Oceanobacillus sp. ISL-73]
MEKFIKNHQYNHIKNQALNIVNAYSTIQDKKVIEAVKFSALEKITNEIYLDDEQETLIKHIVHLKEKEHIEQFLEGITPYIIPFGPITEKSILKQFPKAKKLQLPNLQESNFSKLSYLSWFDTRAQRKYIIFEYKNGFKGFGGTFKPLYTKGICSLCNQLNDVGLFMARAKSGKETYVNRGNYICSDSDSCNAQITNLQYMEKFIETQLK